MTREEKRHVAAWLVLPLLAVANGAIRDFTYGRALDYDLAHSISVAPLLAAIMLWAVVLDRRWPLSSRGGGIRVGACWLLLTLIFEFGLGALQGLSLATMLAEYDVTEGRLWPLVPLGAAAAPELARIVGARRRGVG